MLPWQPILTLKLAKSAHPPIFVTPAFGNGLQYSTSDFKSFICYDLATSCDHLMNFRPVTLEFKRMKDAHPSSISRLVTFALLLDLAGISTEFSGAIRPTTQFCFTHTLEGVTTMSHGLHAGLCHAFLLFFKCYWRLVQ